MVRCSEGSALSSADALVFDHYRSKQLWVEFNDDLLDDTAQGIDLVERSEAWNRVNKLFRNLEKDDLFALQMVAIDVMSLRQIARAWGFSDDSAEARETRPQHHREEVERCSLFSRMPVRRDPSVPGEF